MWVVRCKRMLRCKINAFKVQKWAVKCRKCSQIFTNMPLCTKKCSYVEICAAMCNWVLWCANTCFYVLRCVRKCCYAQKSESSKLCETCVELRKSVPWCAKCTNIFDNALRYIKMCRNVAPLRLEPPSPAVPPLPPPLPPPPLPAMAPYCSVEQNYFSNFGAEMSCKVQKGEYFC